MRSRDAFGNLSGWTSVAATTATSAGSSAGSRWVLNSSTGLYDEYISPDPARFVIHPLETSTQVVDYAEWVGDFEYVPGQSYGESYSQPSHGRAERDASDCGGGGVREKLGGELS